MTFCMYNKHINMFTTLELIRVAYSHTPTKKWTDNRDSGPVANIVRKIGYTWGS